MIYKNVIDEITSRKTESEMLASQRLSRAMQNEQFKNLYKTLKTLEIENSKKEFLKEDTQQIEDEIKNTKIKIEKELNSLKLSLKDFQPEYHCKKCNDTGILKNNYCDCFYELLNKKLISNIGANIDRSHTFDNSNFDLFDNKEMISKIYSKIREWCERIKDTKYKNLVISGATGVGKTYLSECICNEFINKDMIINFHTAFSLNNIFYKYATTFGNEKMAILDDVLKCDVLFIDDFGSEPKMKNSEEYFYTLINERTLNKKITIISTNLSPIQILDRYGERTFSRISNKANSLMIKIENSDLRLKKRN